VVAWSDAVLQESLRSLARSDGVLTETDLFRFHLSPQGDVIDSGPPSRVQRELLRAISTRGVRRLATLVNDTVGPDGQTIQLKDAAVVHDILARPERRARLITQIRTVLADEGFEGFDLDFENLHSADRETFSAFVRELASKLHDDDMRLVITVHPQARPEQRDGPGAQDLAALAKAADEIRMMAYHYHYEDTEPGAAAPLSWVQALIEHALQSVPPEKLSLALYVGGWRWDGRPGAQVSFAEATDLARSLGAATERLPEDDVVHFHSASNGTRTEVWYEDACSLFHKAALAKRYHLRGIALWHLSEEDPRLFAALRSGGKECRDGGPG
jgi:spore germination protein YaaH